MSVINIKSKQRVPRKIEAQEISPRYARGWHCLGLASNYTDKPVRLDYFGTNLVAYRGKHDNQVHVLDAYCPHMGGNLSLGCVDGDSVRCPFHDWRWGPDGVCNDIPYAKRIPEQAVIKAWPTVEENHLLFVWNDPENSEPIPEQRIPRIDDCFSDEWSRWAVDKMRINTNCRELVDNMADYGHFEPVHKSPVKEFSNIVEGHTYQQKLTGTSEGLAGDGELTSVATYYGPSYMNTYMTGQMGGMDIASRLLVAHVPVHTECFDLFFGVMVKKNKGLSNEETKQMVDGYVEANRIAFGQDVDIWHTKTRVDNPVLCDGDGPVNVLRKWYSQFYMDISEVPSALKKRKIYERKAG